MSRHEIMDSRQPAGRRRDRRPRRSAGHRAGVNPSTRRNLLVGAAIWLAAVAGTASLATWAISSAGAPISAVGVSQPEDSVLLPTRVTSPEPAAGSATMGSKPATTLVRAPDGATSDRVSEVTEGSEGSARPGTASRSTTSAATSRTPAGLGSTPVVAPTPVASTAPVATTTRPSSGPTSPRPSATTSPSVPSAGSPTPTPTSSTTPTGPPTSSASASGPSPRPSRRR
ncbi:MAG: hypothetical protein IPG94_02260 [Kineosporiaceae bacterium]|nr:hypothetical protein [Kineosporiaceae bacterium]